MLLSYKLAKTENYRYDLIKIIIWNSIVVKNPIFKLFFEEKHSNFQIKSQTAYDNNTNACKTHHNPARKQKRPLSKTHSQTQPISKKHPSAQTWRKKKDHNMPRSHYPLHMHSFLHKSPIGAWGKRSTVFALFPQLFNYFLRTYTHTSYTHIIYGKQTSRKGGHGPLFGCSLRSTYEGNFFAGHNRLLLGARAFFITSIILGVLYSLVWCGGGSRVSCYYPSAASIYSRVAISTGGLCDWWFCGGKMVWFCIFYFFLV